MGVEPGINNRRSSKRKKRDDEPSLRLAQTEVDPSVCAVESGSLPQETQKPPKKGKKSDLSPKPVSTIPVEEQVGKKHKEKKTSKRSRKGNENEPAISTTIETETLQIPPISNEVSSIDIPKPTGITGTTVQEEKLTIKKNIAKEKTDENNNTSSFDSDSEDVEEDDDEEQEDEEEEEEQEGKKNEKEKKKFTTTTTPPVIDIPVETSIVSKKVTEMKSTSTATSEDEESEQEEKTQTSSKSVTEPIQARDITLTNNNKENNYEATNDSSDYSSTDSSSASSENDEPPATQVNSTNKQTRILSKQGSSLSTSTIDSSPVIRNSIGAKLLDTIQDKQTNNISKSQLNEKYTCLLEKEKNTRQNKDLRFPDNFFIRPLEYPSTADFGKPYTSPSLELRTCEQIACDNLQFLDFRQTVGVLEQAERFPDCTLSEYADKFGFTQQENKDDEMIPIFEGWDPEETPLGPKNRSSIVAFFEQLIGSLSKASVLTFDVKPAQNTIQGHAYTSTHSFLHNMKNSGNVAVTFDALILRHETKGLGLRTMGGSVKTNATLDYILGAVSVQPNLFDVRNVEEQFVRFKPTKNSVSIVHVDPNAVLNIDPITYNSLYLKVVILSSYLQRSVPVYITDLVTNLVLKGEMGLNNKGRPIVTYEFLSMQMFRKRVLTNVKSKTGSKLANVLRGVEDDAITQFQTSEQTTGPTTISQN